MAFATKSHVGDGSTTDFAVTFDYLDRTHVVVRINKVETTALGATHAFSWVNDTTIRVVTYPGGVAAAVDADIEFIRRTPISTPAVVFGGGAALSSENLNKNSEYLTFALQEATDTSQAFTKLYLGAYDASPTTDNEGQALQIGAVYYDNLIQALFYWTGTTWIIGESTVAAEVFKDAAAASAAAALASQVAAAASQSSSSGSASSASSSASSASASATAANGSAITAAADAASTAADVLSSVAILADTASERIDAQAAASAASSSATVANLNASSATASAASASASASSASSSAGSASTSASNAAGSEATATTKAGEAAASAAAAATFDPSVYAPLSSPALTGTPTAPTAAAAANNAQIATTAYTRTAIPNVLNASGSAPLYACRAWVNFNGTGTVAIRASGNVSSITDNGTGDYTVNFTEGVEDANYAAVASANQSSRPVAVRNYTVSSIGVQTSGGGSSTAPLDNDFISVAIFR